MNLNNTMKLYDENSPEGGGIEFFHACYPDQRTRPAPQIRTPISDGMSADARRELQSQAALEAAMDDFGRGLW